MRLEKRVCFELYTDLFYWWNKSDGGREFRKSERKEQLVPQKSDSLVQQVKNWCAYICNDAKNNVDKKMYPIYLSRYVHVIDRDIDSLLSFNFWDKDCKFILATDGQLVYPSDVRDTLHVPFYFEKVVFPKDMNAVQKSLPVFIERYNEYYAVCRPLNNDDIVVDSNLNQLWPLNGAGKTPNEIIALLKKKNEVIHNAR